MEDFKRRANFGEIFVAANDLAVKVGCKIAVIPFNNYTCVTLNTHEFFNEFKDEFTKKKFKFKEDHFLRSFYIT